MADPKNETVTPASVYPAGAVKAKAPTATPGSDTKPAPAIQKLTAAEILDMRAKQRAAAKSPTKAVVPTTEAPNG